MIMENKTYWTIIDPAVINKKIKCRCICGVERFVNKFNVIRGLTKCCGCIKEIKTPELTEYHGIKKGDKVGRLTIIEPFRKLMRNGYNEDGSVAMDKVIYFKAQCDCGKILDIRGRSIIYGETKSCGCTELGPRKIGKVPRHFYRYLKVQANQRNLSFNLKFDELAELFDDQQHKCALSGVDLWFRSNSKTPDGNASLDRIDSSKGYITGNVQWVHVNINYAKLALSDTEFIEMCKRVVEHTKNR
jgi:hypothetical protein